MKKFVVSVVALAGLVGVGWWGYQTQRAAPGPALEISGKDGKSASGPDGPARTGAVGQAAGGAAGGSNTGPGGTAAGPGGTGTQGRPGGPGGGPGGGRGPVGVEAVKASVAALADEVQAVGTLRANESVIIRPEIAGRIVQIGFTDGARVNRGALLVELDGSVLAAQAEQARAELGLARTSFERTEDLAKRNFVSGSARDQAAATLKIQAARLELAEAQLAKTRITAPFNGVLGLRNISRGDFVKDGADLVMLEDVSSMKVDLRLPERYIGQLRRGQSIVVNIDAFPGRDFVARLDALDAQVDANGRAVLARGRLANSEGLLRTGMFAKARIRLKEKPTATVIPEEAIFPVGADAFVYRVDAGKAVRTQVRTGIRRNGQVEVLAGVEPGDLVITAGQLKIQRDGTEVRVVEPARRSPAATSSGPPAATAAPAAVTAPPAAAAATGDADGKGATPARRATNGG